MPGVRGLWVLVLFCLTLFFHGLTDNDLWSSHEARAAQNAQRMIDDGDWLLPRLYDGTPELQKPPAYYWLVAAVGGLRGGGVDRWAVRLPTAIAGLATVLMVWGFLVSRGRPAAGLIAGVVLAGAVHFNSLARTGRIDMVLTCATTAAVLLLQSSSRRATLAAGPLCGFALLLKGPIGLALPSAVQSVLLARRRAIDGHTDWLQIARLALVGTLGAGTALPWYMWVNTATNGDFVRVFFWHHNVDRMLGDSADLAVHPWWYYLPRFLIDFMPGTLLLLAAAWWSFRRGIDNGASFGAVWLGTMLAILSLSQFKRSDYLLPAFPGAAIFLGCVGERWYALLTVRRQRVACAVSAGLMVLSLAGWEWFHRSIEPKQQAVREQAAFAEFIRAQAPAPNEVFFFQVESHLLAYHVGRPLRTLVAWDDFNDRLRKPSDHWVVTRVEGLPEIQARASRKLEVVAFSESFTPAKPLRPLVLLRTVPE